MSHGPPRNHAQRDVLDCISLMAAQAKKHMEDRDPYILSPTWRTQRMPQWELETHLCQARAHLVEVWRLLDIPFVTRSTPEDPMGTVNPRRDEDQ